jgi:hypothetical protein
VDSTARLVWVALTAACLVGLDARRASRSAVSSSSLEPAAPAATPTPTANSLSPCPSGTLSDHGVCIPVPALPGSSDGDGARLQLMPGRPEDYARYETPLRSAPNGVAVGGSVFFAAPVGSAVVVVALESQAGPARKLRAAPAPAAPLLTLHRVTRNGATRSYLLSYEGLAADAAEGPLDLAAGASLGRIVSAAGLTPGLRLGVRELRRGVDPDQVPVERLLGDSHSVECDPRNVLPLRP